MQEILVLLQQLKSSLLNIRNFPLSEPQLTPEEEVQYSDWTVVKRIGRTRLLDSGMLKKIKNIRWEQEWLGESSTDVSS